MTEHVQRAMFGNDGTDHPIDIEMLAQAAHDLREAARDTAYVQGELLRYLQGIQREQQTDIQGFLDHPEVKSLRPYTPRKEWRDWPTFVRIMQAFAADGITPVSKEWVAAQAGVVPRTIRRAMKYHGLGPDDWPPATWDPRHPPAKKKAE